MIGAILIESSMFAVAASMVTPDMFFRDAHRRIFGHLCDMSATGKPLDLVLLAEVLKVSGDLDEVGGPAYVAGLMDGVPRSTNVQHYAALVREHAQLRATISAATAIMDEAYAADEPSSEVVGRGVESLMRCIKTSEGGLVNAAAAMASYVNGLDSAPPRVATGYTDLDVLLKGGFRAGDFVIVAARPSVGKTSFALGAFRHMARQGLRVPFFSLEMTQDGLAARLMSWESGVPSGRLEDKTATPEDYARVIAALESTGCSSLLIESTARSITEIGAWCRRAQQSGGIHALGIDYVQLMVPEKAGHDASSEMASISGAVKRLAKELKVPAIGLSQLSRAAEERRDKRPQLSDLRQSGALEQDCDVALLLFREEMHVKRDDNAGIAEVIVAKHRDGPTGVTRLAFVHELAQFRDLAHGF